MRRGKKLSLRSRVPTRYASVEPRREIWLSLHTDSETIAQKKAPLIWAEQIEAWEARLAGDTNHAEQRFKAAQGLAQMRGYSYLSAAKIAELPLEDMMARIETVAEQKSSPHEAAAVLGGVATPPITVQRALELYWGLTRDLVQGKSPDQMRRWENPRKKAVRNFVDVIGDKELALISADDMLDFRAYWMERIETEDLTANSANKDLIHLGDVLKTVNLMKRLGLSLPLSNLSFKEHEAQQRPPFSPAWIREKLLAPGALAGLNDDAKGILLAMVNTGARPSELAGLTAAQIHLLDEVPHVSIEPIGRTLKNASSRRKIPLLGVSLQAMRAFPDGFRRYQSGPATLSATINKFLRENGLMETPLHTLYGLRHSFEDRMLAAGIDERIRRDLMGHSLGRERYGAGGTLTMRADLLGPVSIG